MVGGMTYHNPPPHTPEDTESVPAGKPALMARPQFTPSDCVQIIAALLLLAVSLGIISPVVSFPAAVALVVLGARKWWFPKQKIEADL